MNWSTTTLYYSMACAFTMLAAANCHLVIVPLGEGDAAASADGSNAAASGGAGGIGFGATGGNEAGDAGGAGGSGGATSGGGSSGSGGNAGLPIAAPCGMGGDCDSGFCVDGVCCADACAGLCMSCNEPPEAGVCTAAAAGTAQNGECGSEACSGNAGECAPPEPCGGCLSTEYCFQDSCHSKPTIAFDGAEGASCGDMNVAHPDSGNPGYLVKTTILGRPFAAWTRYNRHLSCGTAATWWVTSSGVFDASGKNEVLLAHANPLGCNNLITGRWESYVVVDGQISASAYFNYYQSGCVGGPTTCAAANNYCPPTGACNAPMCL